MVKRILSLISALAMIIAISQPVSAAPSNSGNRKNDVLAANVNGIASINDSSASPIESASEFNYTLSQISLKVNNNTAIVETEIDGKKVKFTPKLYQNQLGNNTQNRFFGVDSKVSTGFELVKFSIDLAASDVSLMKPNRDMAGNTVVSIGFLSRSNNQTYYFEFIANDIKAPVGLVADENMVVHELANFGAQPFDIVKKDMDSLQLEMASESSTQGTQLEGFSALNAEITSEEALPVQEIAPILTTEKSEESLMFDRLIEESQNGPISLRSNTRALVSGIPDYLYKTSTYGWTQNGNGWQAIGSNASSLVAYIIYHMPDLYECVK